MKTLPQKVAAVRKVFADLDREIKLFQERSGLMCISGCGECCKKPDIEATVIEMLPMALSFFDQGKAESVLEEIQSSGSSLCYVFRPHITNFGGLCSAYPDRGLICRLFGFTARRNKEGRNELVTCRLIKEKQSLLYEQAVAGITAGEKIPVMPDYYIRLSTIDHNLVDFHPINKALAHAIETVLHYYAYRKRRKPVTKVI